jgi:hypothetical protein
VIFVAALSFAFFLAMLLGFYVREQIGYFILSSAFLVIYILTMVGWLLLKRQKLGIHENGISYRRAKVLWSEISRVEDLDPRSFAVKGSDGTTLTVSDAVTDWRKVREIIAERSGF